MGLAPAKLRKLAQRLLDSDAPRKEGDGSAAFRVIGQLRQPLSVLVGSAGFRALLSRALALGSEEVRWLNGIHVNANGSLERLAEVCAQLPPDEIARGEAILIARLIGLLVTFIGAPLTAQLLQDVWPGISPYDLDSETEENDG